MVGDMISTPFRRDIASTRDSLFLYPAYHFLSTVWGILYDRIFGELANLAHVVINTAKDYWDSDYSYTRYFFRLALGLLILFGRGLSKALSMLYRLIFK